MRKLLILLIITMASLAACAPPGDSKRLNKSLTPEAENGEHSSTATWQRGAETTSSTPPPGGKNLQPQLAQANIPLDEVVALLPPDAIPAILPDEAEEIMVSADYAKDNDIDPEGYPLKARHFGTLLNLINMI